MKRKRDDSNESDSKGSDEDEKLSPNKKRQRKERKLIPFIHEIGRLVAIYSSSTTFQRREHFVNSIVGIVRYPNRLESKFGNSDTQKNDIVIFLKFEFISNIECRICDSQVTEGRQPLWCGHVISTLIFCQRFPERVTDLKNFEALLRGAEKDCIIKAVLSLADLNPTPFNALSHLSQAISLSRNESTYNPTEKTVEEDEEITPYYRNREFGSPDIGDDEEEEEEEEECEVDVNISQFLPVESEEKSSFPKCHFISISQIRRYFSDLISEINCHENELDCFCQGREGGCECECHPILATPASSHPQTEKLNKEEIEGERTLPPHVEDGEESENRNVEPRNQVRYCWNCRNYLKIRNLVEYLNEIRSYCKKSLEMGKLSHFFNCFSVLFVLGNSLTSLNSSPKETDDPEFFSNISSRNSIKKGLQEVSETMTEVIIRFPSFLNPQQLSEITNRVNLWIEKNQYNRLMLQCVLDSSKGWNVGGLQEILGLGKLVFSKLELPSSLASSNYQHEDLTVSRLRVLSILEDWKDLKTTPKLLSVSNYCAVMNILPNFRIFCLAKIILRGLVNNEQVFLMKNNEKVTIEKIFSELKKSSRQYPFLFIISVFHHLVSELERKKKRDLDPRTNFIDSFLSSSTNQNEKGETTGEITQFFRYLIEEKPKTLEIVKHLISQTEEIVGSIISLNKRDLFSMEDEEEEKEEKFSIFREFEISESILQKCFLLLLQAQEKTKRLIIEDEEEEDFPIAQTLQFLIDLKYFLFFSFSKPEGREGTQILTIQEFQKILNLSPTENDGSVLFESTCSIILKNIESLNHPESQTLMRNQISKICVSKLRNLMAERRSSFNRENFLSDWNFRFENLCRLFFDRVLVSNGSERQQEQVTVMCEFSNIIMYECIKILKTLDFPDCEIENKLEHRKREYDFFFQDYLQRKILSRLETEDLSPELMNRIIEYFIIFFHYEIQNVYRSSVSELSQRLEDTYFEEEDETNQNKLVLSLPSLMNRLFFFLRKHYFVFIQRYQDHCEDGIKVLLFALFHHFFPFSNTTTSPPNNNGKLESVKKEYFKSHYNLYFPSRVQNWYFGHLENLENDFDIEFLPIESPKVLLNFYRNWIFSIPFFYLPVHQIFTSLVSNSRELGLLLSYSELFLYSELFCQRNEEQRDGCGMDLNLLFLIKYNQPIFRDPNLQDVFLFQNEGSFGEFEACRCSFCKDFISYLYSPTETKWKLEISCGEEEEKEKGVQLLNHVEEKYGFFVSMTWLEKNENPLFPLRVILLKREMFDSNNIQNNSNISNRERKMRLMFEKVERELERVKRMENLLKKKYLNRFIITAFTRIIHYIRNSDNNSNDDDCLHLLDYFMNVLNNLVPKTTSVHFFRRIFDFVNGMSNLEKRKRLSKLLLDTLKSKNYEIEKKCLSDIDCLDHLIKLYEFSYQLTQKRLSDLTNDENQMRDEEEEESEPNERKRGLKSSLTSRKQKYKDKILDFSEKAVYFSPSVEKFEQFKNLFRSLHPSFTMTGKKEEEINESRRIRLEWMDRTETMYRKLRSQEPRFFNPFLPTTENSLKILRDFERNVEMVKRKISLYMYLASSGFHSFSPSSQQKKVNLSIIENSFDLALIYFTKKRKKKKKKSTSSSTTTKERNSDLEYFSCFKVPKCSFYDEEDNQLFWNNETGEEESNEVGKRHWMYKKYCSLLSSVLIHFFESFKINVFGMFEEMEKGQKRAILKGFLNKIVLKSLKKLIRLDSPKSKVFWNMIEKITEIGTYFFSLSKELYQEKMKKILNSQSLYFQKKKKKKKKKIQKDGVHYSVTDFLLSWILIGKGIYRKQRDLRWGIDMDSWERLVKSNDCIVPNLRNKILKMFMKNKKN